MAARHCPHTMNHDLLKAVATGDADLLAQVLGVWPAAATVEQQVVEGEESCLLQGVTAEGSSALHIAAGRGHLELVVMICTQDTSLIKARNNRLDTSLICAARAGHEGVVDYLVRCASAELEEAEESVIWAKNSAGETVMHEAVRNGHASVLEKLMAWDSRLATSVDGKGVSPLYLAVVSNRADMVHILIRESSDGAPSPASFAGPDGQTALHAAVYASKGQEMSESLICWDPTLAKKVDGSGRTALHYAASAGKISLVRLLLRTRSLAYIPDNNGLFPVHTAAVKDRVKVIREFVKTCPGSDELLDNKQRNILHCAVAHGRFKLVFTICRMPKFLGMINARDCDGNTPLHLAVKDGNGWIFVLVMMNIKVDLSIMNNMGLTPLDVAGNNISIDYTFSLYTSVYIVACLQLCEAYHRPSTLTRDLIDEQCLDEEDKVTEPSKYTNVSQSILCISVLVATGSFTAAFTVPGGYISEGERAGMLVIAGVEDLFGMFVFSNLFSFVFSTAATCLLVHGSLTTIHKRSRRSFLLFSAVMVYWAVFFMLIIFTTTMSLTMDPANSWDEYFLTCLIVLAEQSVKFLMLFLPLACLGLPVLWLRSVLQLRTIKHPWRTFIIPVSAAILVLHFVKYLVNCPRSPLKCGVLALKPVLCDRAQRVRQVDAFLTYPIPT